MKQHIVQTISNFFHPLLSLTWAMVLLVLFSPLQMLPIDIRLLMVGEVFFYSFLLPSLIIILMAKVGIVKNGIALRDRKDRVLPLSVYMILCFVQAYILSRQGLPSWALNLFWGGAALSVIFVIVTFWWKISGHAAGNTSLAVGAMILYFYFPAIIPFFIPILLIVIAGGVSSIRLYLGRHTSAQIAIGSLAGALCMVGAYLLL